MTKIQEMANNGSLIKERHIPFSLTIWENENSKSFKNYISNLNTIEKISFLLSCLVGTSHTFGSNTYKSYELMKESPLYKYLSPIHDAAVTFFNKNNISNMDEDDKYRYGAFMLLYDRQNNEKTSPHIPGTEITDEMVKEYLENL